MICHFRHIYGVGPEGGRRSALLMFVHTSQIAEDQRDALCCSLNLASRAREIEHGPACKQADSSDHFKFKQMIEKLKQDEKDRKTLEENLQPLQLENPARNQICRIQLEKIGDLRNQSAEDTQTRLQPEARTSAVAAASNSSVLSASQCESLQYVRKPARGPSEPRDPVSKLGTALPDLAPQAANEKDPGASTGTSSKVLMRCRRVSTAVRRTTETTQAIQPRHKREQASTATAGPHTQLLSAMNQVDTPTIQMQHGGIMAGHLSANDPLRESRRFSPIPVLTSSGPALEAHCKGGWLVARRQERQVVLH